MAGRCFLCGRAVLGLRGQDLFIDSALVPQPLPPGWGTNDCGSCHGACLRDSALGVVWHEILLQFHGSHFAARAVDDGHGAWLISNRTGGNVTVLDGSGLKTGLSGRQLLALAREGWGSEIRIVHEERLARDRDEDTFQLLRSNLKGGETVPIMNLVKLFGVEELLLDVSSLTGGECTAPEDTHVTLLSGEYWVNLNYCMYVPEHHRSLLREHAAELLSERGYTV